MKSEAHAEAAACGHRLNIRQLHTQIRHTYGLQNMSKMNFRKTHFLNRKIIINRIKVAFGRLSMKKIHTLAYTQTAV